MAKARELPTWEYLNDRFHYDPATGIITWKTRGVELTGCANTTKYWDSTHAGNEVGYENKRGYREVMMKGKAYFIHRIAWKLVTKCEPPSIIDHINQVRGDNRWVNLRELSHAQNVCNSNKGRGRVARGVRKTTGGKFVAETSFTKMITIGTYDTEAEASAAYNKYRGV